MGWDARIVLPIVSLDDVYAIIDDFVELVFMEDEPVELFLLGELVDEL